jgi:hypothetical protein
MEIVTLTIDELELLLAWGDFFLESHDYLEEENIREDQDLYWKVQNKLTEARIASQ